MSIDRLNLIQSVPDAPPSGHSFIYVDPNDGKLKEINNAGTRKTYEKYQNGTWSLSDQSGAGLSLTTTGTPKYIKIGKLVYVKGRVTYPTNSDTSNARLGTLPFTVENNASVAGGGIGFTDGGIPTFINAQSNSALLAFENSDGAQTTNADLSGRSFTFSITYISA